MGGRGGGREGEGDTTLLNNCGASQIKNSKVSLEGTGILLVSMEEIHFKLYRMYQKEQEILDPFKNSRTALQKKLKITGVLVKKKKKIIKI